MATKNKWWGRSLNVDLRRCDPYLVKDSRAMAEFVPKLCRLINMKRRGPVRLQRFGRGNLQGWSLMQFIETSSITAHFDEKGNRAFIDIFSCKAFNPQIAAAFCRKYFRARSMAVHVEERQ